MSDETSPVVPSKGKVLFVDDDKFLVDMYSMKFTSNGYQVQACLSVSEALEAIAQGFAPDAIVFDIVMPDKDGFALLEELHKSGKSTMSLIALTNQSNDA
jgi:two-component system, OmpR family, response regulator